MKKLIFVVFGFALMNTPPTANAECISKCGLEIWEVSAKDKNVYGDPLLGKKLSVTPPQDVDIYTAKGIERELYLACNKAADQWAQNPNIAKVISAQKNAKAIGSPSGGQIYCSPAIKDPSIAEAEIARLKAELQALANKPQKPCGGPESKGQ